jgi:dCMP deaminase
MRPSKEKYFLEIAKVVATRSTCLRRSVGCVLTNARGHIIATGYNGTYSGSKHCNEAIIHMGPSTNINGKYVHGGEKIYPNACAGAFSPSGTNLNACDAIHAEQNALMQCRDVHEIDTAYVTVSPCINCLKLLLATSCKRIVFADEYPHVESKQLWESSGREWIHNSLDLLKSSTN